MTAPLTSRRRYSNVAPAALLNTGINASDTAYALTTGTGFPPTPFPLILDFDGAAEEAVLVTGMSGANVTNCTRGYDGTTAQSHSVGATCVHGMIAKDAEEASQHTSSTGAHGTASPIVGTTDAQTLTNKTISSSKLLATPTDPAVKAQAAGTGAAQLFEAYDAAGTGLLFRVGRAGDLLVSPNDPNRKPIVAKAEAAQVVSLIEAQDNVGSALWVVDAKGRIFHKPSDQTQPAVKHVRPSSSSGVYLQLRDETDSTDQLSVNNAGEITNAARIALRGSGSANPIQFPLDASKFKVDSNGNIVAAGSLTADTVIADDVVRRVARFSDGSGPSGGATEVVGNTHAYPVVGGRRYSVRVLVTTTAASGVTIRQVTARVSSGTVTNTSQLIEAMQRSYAGGNASRDDMTFEGEFVAGATATWNIALGVSTEGGAGLTTITTSVVTVYEVGV